MARTRLALLLRFMTLILAVAFTAVGCQPAEVGTVGVPRPVGPDGKPLPARPKGGEEPAPKAKGKGSAPAKADPGGK